MPSTLSPSSLEPLTQSLARYLDLTKTPLRTFTIAAKLTRKCSSFRVRVRGL
jgi:hypothetical protein